MIRAVFISLFITILVLAFTAVFFWGKERKAVVNLLEADSKLAAEKVLTRDLRVSLAEAKNTSEKLKTELEAERLANLKFKQETEKLNGILFEKQEKIRILEREDKEFFNWSNVSLPFGVIGMLNESN